MENEQIKTRPVSTVSEAQKRAVRKYYDKRKDTEEYKLNNSSYQRKFYQNNREKILAYKKEYYNKKKQEELNILLPDIVV